MATWYELETSAHHVFSCLRFEKVQIQVQRDSYIPGHSSFAFWACTRAAKAHATEAWSGHEKAGQFVSVQAEQRELRWSVGEFGIVCVSASNPRPFQLAETAIWQRSAHSREMCSGQVFSSGRFRIDRKQLDLEDNNKVWQMVFAMGRYYPVVIEDICYEFLHVQGYQYNCKHFKNYHPCAWKMHTSILK